MAVNCLIADDNRTDRFELKKFLQEHTSFKVLDDCETGSACKEILIKESVDVLFLCLSEEQSPGVDFLKSLGCKPCTVMISDQAAAAKDTYELNVVDYVSKPFSAERLLRSIHRVQEILCCKDGNCESPTTKYKDYLFVRDKKLIRKINLHELLWIEAKGDFVQIRTDEKAYLIHTSMKNIEQKLAAQHFFRVHRKFIINIDQLDVIEDDFARIKDKSIPISKHFKEELLHVLDV